MRGYFAESCILVLITQLWHLIKYDRLISLKSDYYKVIRHFDIFEYQIKANCFLLPLIWLQWEFQCPIGSTWCSYKQKQRETLHICHFGMEVFDKYVCSLCCQDLRWEEQYHFHFSSRLAHSMKGNRHISQNIILFLYFQ